MEGKVLFIEGAQSFVNQSVVSSLESAGMEVMRTEQSVAKIEPYLDDAEILLFYPAGNASLIGGVMNFLLGVSKDRGMALCLVGEEQSIAVARKLDTENRVFAVYERPVDTAKMIADIKSVATYKKEVKQSKAILVVDDDEEYLAIITGWLKAQYQVEGVHSGEEALKYLRARRVDLILLDYEMPGMDGYQTMQKIREDTELAGIPIMFLTGKGDRESVLHILQGKPNGYLLKMTPRKDALDMIGQVLSSGTAS